MTSLNLAKIVKALINNPDDDPIHIIREMGGEPLNQEQLAIVFEMSIAELLAAAEDSQREAEQARICSAIV